MSANYIVKLSLKPRPKRASLFCRLVQEYRNSSWRCKRREKDHYIGLNFIKLSIIEANIATTRSELLPFTVGTFLDSTIGHGSMPNNIESTAEAKSIEIAVLKVSVS